MLRERYAQAYWPIRVLVSLILIPFNVVGALHWIQGDDSAAIGAAFTMNFLSHGWMLDLARFVPGISPIVESLTTHARPLGITLLSGALMERALNRPLDEGAHFFVAFICLWLAGHGRLVLFPLACMMNMKLAFMGTLVFGQNSRKNIWFMAVCALYMADVQIPRCAIAWALSTWTTPSTPHPLIAPLVMAGCTITVLGVMLRDSL